MSNLRCACLSGEVYQRCCRPLHDNEQTASNAEKLMRSRYCAFVMHRADYLTRTHHPDTKPDNLFDDLQQHFSDTEWLGLTIRSHHQEDNSAEVEFIAFYQDDPIGQLHERSRFSKHNNQWCYVDGQFSPPIKLNRNQPCFCGSGRKFKHCHG